MLTRNLRKRDLQINKLEVVVVKIYTPLTGVKNNSKIRLTPSKVTIKEWSSL